MLPQPQFSIGSKVSSVPTGVVFVKTAADYWQPSPEAASLGWEPFTATDEHINTCKQFAAVTLFARLDKRRQRPANELERDPTIWDRILGAHAGNGPIFY